MQMQQKNMWLPIVASVGIGAAAYYSMTKGNRSIGNALQQMAPIIPAVSGGGLNQSSQPAQSTQSMQSTQPTQQNQLDAQDKEIQQDIENVLS